MKKLIENKNMITKDTIIIVEGPQGVGKTTFTNYLREKMSSTDLYRLSGIKDKSETGLQKMKEKYLALLEYIDKCKDVNMIFDRTFFTEEIYSKIHKVAAQNNISFNLLVLRCCKYA